MDDAFHQRNSIALGNARAAFAGKVTNSLSLNILLIKIIYFSLLDELCLTRTSVVTPRAESRPQIRLSAAEHFHRRSRATRRSFSPSSSTDPPSPMRSFRPLRQKPISRVSFCLAMSSVAIAARSMIYARIRSDKRHNRPEGSSRRVYLL